MSWKDFERGAPQLAEFGVQRLASEVAYLATLRKDGSPRVHPVTPIVGRGHLFVFMEPTSPKGHDLRRDGRYALHTSVRDAAGTGGEFTTAGQARLIEDPELRSLAAQLAPYTVADRYVLFELGVESASSTLYEAGDPVRQRWKRS